MKKTALYLVIFILIFGLGGCKAHRGPKPTEFPKTRWVSENPSAEFIIDKSGVQKLFLTLGGKTEKYAISMEDDFGTSVHICNLNEDPNYNYEFKDILVIGDGTYTSNKFTFKITNDLSGLLEGYDKIVFYRDFEYENKK